MLNLRNLTRLTGSALFQFQEPMLEVRDRYIQRLGTLPRLRYLQIFVGPRYYFVNFERDRNGIYSGHSLLTSYPATDEHDPPGPFSFCRWGASGGGKPFGNPKKVEQILLDWRIRMLLIGLPSVYKCHKEYWSFEVSVTLLRLCVVHFRISCAQNHASLFSAPSHGYTQRGHSYY